MTQQKNKRARRGQPRPHNKADGQSGKKFPNGISATVRAIFSFWHEKTTGEAGALGVEDFCKKTNFRLVHEEVRGKYPGINVAKKSVPTTLREIDLGTRNIAFYELRAISEFVGLQTGLFLLFTQFVSNERHALDNGLSPKKSAAELIASVKRLVDEAEKQIGKTTDEETIFTKSAGAGHLVNVDVLKLWSDAYNNRLAAIDEDQTP